METPGPEAWRVGQVMVNVQHLCPQEDGVGDLWDKCPTMLADYEEVPSGLYQKEGLGVTGP